MEFETKIHNLPIIVEYEIFDDEIEIGDIYFVQLGFGSAHKIGEKFEQEIVDKFITDSDWADIREQAKADYEGVKIDAAGYAMEGR